MKIRVHGGRRFKSRGMAFILIFWVSGLVGLTAQAAPSGPTTDSAAPAILVRGPLDQWGPPLGSANAVPWRYALYRWEDEEIKV